MSEAPRNLVMVLGLQQRAGTNFLHDLLALHPCAAAHGGLAEDFTLHHSGHLEAYLRGLWGRWEHDLQRTGGIDPRPALWAELGGVMERFLRAPEPWTRQTPTVGRTWRITKTPSVEHLGHVRLLFPEVPVLLLVREGRAMVESLHQSFGWSYEESMWAWREGARRILAFQRTRPGRVWRVRYEDLVTALEPTLREVFAFLDWPANDYDFDAARALPVKGSSELRAREGRLHWEPRPAGENFQPLQRGADWPEARRQRLHHLAAAELTALGYDPGPPPPRWTKPWHGLLDCLSAFRRGPLRAWRRRWRRLG